jgi:hypothetical protein
MRAFRAVGGGRIVAHPSITLSATLVAGVTQLVISALAVIRSEHKTSTKFEATSR